MSRLSFSTWWIKLIMMCVSMVKYAILVNGFPSGHTTPTRGIRQGDPISPYLFLICAEALSSILTQANNDGLLTGVPTSKKGPRVSHLYFADDSLLFCRTSYLQWSNLSYILKVYEAASGQQLNANKTAIFFSRNTSVEEKEMIIEMLGIPATQGYDTFWVCQL